MSKDAEFDDLESIRQIFFEECSEQLGALEEELSSLDATCGPGEKINTIFRAVHSIKGGAGAFGMEKLVRFSHLFETVLEKFRSGECQIDHDAVAIFLKAADSLNDIVAFYQEGRPLTAQDGVEAELQTYLNDYTTPENAPASEEAPMEDIDGVFFAPVKIDFDENEEKTFFLLVKPKFSLYSNGDDIRNIISFLKKKGKITVDVNSGSVPCLNEFDLEKVYSQWIISIKTIEEKKSIEEVFEWSFDDIDVEFVDEVEKYKLTTSHKEDNYTEKLSIKNPENFSILESTKKSIRKESPTVRVDTGRVDKLVDLISELVINQGAIRSQMQIHNIRAGSALDIVISELDQLTHELQENVMAMRAHAVKTVFRRMGRIVRETGRIARKDVLLTLEGEETEVDRSILEKISDPLTHMVRNAIDHGLESENKRVAAGKSAQGNLFLRAFHRSGRIIIEVEDDGAGLNCEKIYEKACKKGITSRSVVMEKDEIQNLIFSPGFSTVENVSDLSGRGVGMDVVKRSISEIGGRISIFTEEGKGTRFSISLPLTLAVVEGLIFRIQQQKFIVPVSGVVEAFVFQEQKSFRVSANIKGYPYREEYVPLISGNVLIEDYNKREYGNICLIIENEKKEKMALIVDEIIDQSRFVIKSIEKNYKKINGFSSATILGNGGVALIIDVDVLIGNISRKNLSTMVDGGSQ